MPFLSWQEGSQLLRHTLDADCLLGRDPDTCAVAHPSDGSVSRRHAAITRIRDQWWVRDLGSRNGTRVNAVAAGGQGAPLADGDVVALGDWELRFTQGYPGLEATRFLEHVGDLFDEARLEPDQALTLVRGLELLQRSSEALLEETEAEPLIRSLLMEALKLLKAERGFVVMVEPDRSLRSVHRVGDVQDVTGLSRTVLDYVLVHGTGVASNAPLQDPRFGGQSLMEMGRGPLMAAPLLGQEGAHGVLYIDRPAAGAPFTRLDLAIFEGFVRHGAIVLRHAHLSQQALGHAEMGEELSRARAARHHADQHHADLRASLAGPLGWARALAARQPDGQAIRLQLERLAALLDASDDVGLDPTTEGPLVEPIAHLHGALGDLWRPLLEAVGGSLVQHPAPQGSVWMARSRGLLALQSLAEPLLQALEPGRTVEMAWAEVPEGWRLELKVPGMPKSPSPDPWALRRLRDCGMAWRCEDDTLCIHFQCEPATPVPPSGRPVLGLVGCGVDLQDLFQVVADAHDLELQAHGPEPPSPPVPPHRTVVLDARHFRDPMEVLRRYRRQAAFATVPILVVRALEEQVPELLEAGATDWLPAGFRWEALHHRLQALRGHEELQKKALAAERLDSFRQMAGTLKHEINNPLAVISMQVEMLQMKLPEEARLKKIEEMVERIQGLLQVLQKMREATPEAYADGSKILKLS